MDRLLIIVFRPNGLAPVTLQYTNKSCSSMFSYIVHMIGCWLRHLPEGQFVMGGSQNLERRNVERPIFRSFEIANITIKKDNSTILFSNFFFSFFRNYLNTYNIKQFLILYNIYFPNGNVSEEWSMSEREFVVRYSLFKCRTKCRVVYRPSVRAESSVINAQLSN